MNRTLLTIFFLFSSVVTTFAIPAESDSIKTTYATVVNYFFEKNFMRGEVHLHAPDSSLVSLNHTNPALTYYYNFLGTTGSASSPQLFSLPTELYTSSLTRGYDLLLYTSDSIPSYRTNKRLTELQYSSGAFKEQKISVLHTQNITKNWNAGLMFNRQGVKDFMNYSDTYRSRFALFTSYNTSNNKYHLFAHAFWNRIRNQVNGGLLNDSLFDNTNVSNLGIKGLAYNISNAKESRRRRVVYLSQYYDIGKTSKDSSGVRMQKGPSFLIHHEVSYERNSYSYTDTDVDSSFYRNFFYSTNTQDTLGIDVLRNKVSLLLPADSMHRSDFLKKWSSQIYAENLHTKYSQKQDSTWNNSSVGADTRLQFDSVSFGFAAEGRYVFDGMDKGNYSLDASVFSPEYNFGQFSVSAATLRQNPDLIFRWYDSNNFIWKNDLSNIQSLKTTVSYELRSHFLKLSAERYAIKNYCYIGVNALPEQYSNTLFINSFSLKKSFHWKNWHFINAIYYQKADKTGIIHIPELVTDQSIYLEKKYFRNALLLATGASANYSSLYYADAFMPSNALFYLQNEKKVGGYARIDLFVIAKIKTARIYLKMENAFDGLFKRSYYLTPHYPMPGRVLKFGLVWWFLDQ